MATPLLRNYLTAALRDLARNGLYAAITILGLAAGFAAAILISAPTPTPISATPAHPPK